MKRIINLLLVMAVMVVATQASAQIPTTRNGTQANGIILACYNTVDSLIYDGELLIADTTATIKAFGVKRFSGAALERPRIMGIAVGNIAKSSQGGSGSVLVWGYHPRAHAAKALAAGTPIRPGLINGSFATANDSISMNIGRVLGGVAGATNKDNARYKIMFWGLGGKPTGIL